MRHLTTLIIVLLATRGALAEATLDAPTEAVAGAGLEVSWTGPGENYDSVYVLKPEQPDSASGIHSASILNGRNPLNLTMPDEPGEFEIRYWSRAQRAVLARHRIVLADVPTSLSAPDTAPIGASIEITWESSGNQYDQIALVPAGAASDARALATATVLRKNPVSMTLPETAGDYELRYLTRQNKRLLATHSLTIEDVPAALDGPANPKRGEVVQVTWQGPGNAYDRVEVHAVDAPDGAKAIASAGITGRKNPLTIKLPDAAGRYEYRYVTAREDRILARQAFAIADVDSSLAAPESALAASPLFVGWQGPGNDYDRVELVDTASGETLAQGAILSGRNPVLINVPDVEGDFELRYVTSRANNVLATRPIAVQPAGRLRVVFEREGTTAVSSSSGSGAVELILDASGSMLKRTESGKRRIEIAREVLDQVVREHLPDGQPLALRVFGHREADSCRTDLELALGPLDRERTASVIAGINAMNLAKTPIADSLALVPNDLAGASGPKTIVLITDGEETCDGDPAEVIRSLRASGLDVQLSIVGFAIDDAELKGEFEDWAALGGGSYFDAQSSDELLASLRTVISGPFRVLDADDQVVGEGIIGGSAIVLPAGRYRVRTAGEPARWIDDVVIAPRKTTEAAF